MFETEVLAGIAVAEEKGLDWKAAALNPFLDMARADACILGLAKGGYWRAKEEWDVDAEWMERHGFLIPDRVFDIEDLDYRDTYAELAETWRKAARGELVPA